LFLGTAGKRDGDNFMWLPQGFVTFMAVFSDCQDFWLRLDFLLLRQKWFDSMAGVLLICRFSGGVQEFL